MTDRKPSTNGSSPIDNVEASTMESIGSPFIRSRLTFAGSYSLGIQQSSSKLGFQPRAPNPLTGIPIKSSAKQLQPVESKSAMENQSQSNPKVLCLHGFRTSGAILQKMISRWPQSVLDKLQLHFLDGPFPAQGKSDVESYFDPPYYEWYQRNEDFTEYMGFEECVAYIEDYMIKHGPFDGLLGFSQGAFISAAVPGMQAQGVAFTKIPKIKFLILISGAKFIGFKFGQPKLAANAFSSPVVCPSLHIIGERDFLRAGGINLVESFVDPVVIYHSKGHIIPRLDDANLNTMLSFIDKIQKIPTQEQDQEQEQ